MCVCVCRPAGLQSSVITDISLDLEGVFKAARSVVTVSWPKSIFLDSFCFGRGKMSSIDHNEEAVSIKLTSSNCPCRYSIIVIAFHQFVHSCVTMLCYNRPIARVSHEHVCVCG